MLEFVSHGGLRLCLPFLFCCIVFDVGRARALQGSGFAGPYEPANWTLVTNGGSGSVSTANTPSSITLSGADRGGGNINTDFVVSAVASGQVSFDWDYTTTDSPGYDSFGYLVNGSYSRLTDAPARGSAMLNVVVGDTFGFRVNSVDSCCGAGRSTISNFVYPLPTPVPGPLPVLGAAAAWGWSRKLRRRIRRAQSDSHV